MTNIKITQEAREVAEQVLGEMALGNESRAYAIVQALINQTIDRIAHEADRRMVRYIARANEANEAGDDEIAYGRKECSLAMEFFGDYIRTLKDN